MELINAILFLFAFLCSIPLLVVTIELLTTLLIGTDSTSEEPAEAKIDFSILMPAHNEEAVIEQTLTKLLEQSVPASSVYVVADNCSDNTAELAASLGVNVIVRFNDKLKGKGYALDYGFQHIQQKNQHGCVIILDADCEISYRSLTLIAKQSMEQNRPIQALYLMRVANKTSFGQRVAGFAWLVKNKLRPQAVEYFNIPVTLTGTGMAFPIEVLKQVKLAHGNIVEDMQLGIDLTMKGYSPRYRADAVVYSDFPEVAEAEKSQRTRWEHGHIQTIIQQVPTLLKASFQTKSIALIGLALDLSVPPLALLVTSAVSVTALYAILAAFDIATSGFLLLLNIGALFLLTMMITWFRFGQEYLSFTDFVQVPRYIFSKLGIYSGFVKNQQKDWVKTERDKVEK